MCITKFTTYAIKSQLKNYLFIVILRLFSLAIFFLIFFYSLFFFLQTYYDICFFHILFFYFFLLQISFCIYLLLALLIFLYHFHNNLLLYLVSRLCFFDNKLNQQNCIQRSCTHLFFIYNKKIIKHPFYQPN